MISSGFLVSGRAPLQRHCSCNGLSDFRQRAAEKPEDLGDTAAAAQRYDEAISLYTTALSLKPLSPQGILVKRSKMYTMLGSWEQALDDANQVHYLVSGRSIPLTHHP